MGLPEQVDDDRKVFDISAYRARRYPRTHDREEEPMATRDEHGFDGQHTVYRGNLYVHIDENGRVDYDIVRAERHDAPTLVLACLAMCMKLTQLIDEDLSST